MSDPAELTAERIAKDSSYLTLQNIFVTLIVVSGLAFMARMITPRRNGSNSGTHTFNVFSLVDFRFCPYVS